MSTLVGIIIISMVWLVLNLISIVSLNSLVPLLAARQFVFILLAAVTGFLVARIPFSKWLQWRWLLYGSLIALLIATLVVANVTRNTARWLDFGFFRLQPSQFAVPIVGLVVAERLTHSHKKWAHIIATSLLVMIPAALILVEPDLGTTVLLISTVGVGIFLSDISWRQLSLILVGILVTSVFVWIFILQPYQKQRIFSFINPSQGTISNNYNSRQALIAVGSGKLLGAGIGQGTQSQLAFLPEKHTDFIFSAISEEWGFIGSTLLIFLYVIMVVTQITFTLKQHNLSHYYFGWIALFGLSVHVFVNISINTGILPVKGLTLPFVSYGGSSLLAFTILLGIVVSSWHQIPSKSHIHFQ